MRKPASWRASLLCFGCPLACEANCGGVLMTFTGISRIASLIAVSVAAVFLIATEIVAQSSGTVDCGNGLYCPRGHACLVGGLCGPEIDQPPGSMRLSNGKFCDPGFREHRYRPGGCVPGSYVDCPDGFMCSPGSSCAPTGGCEGGPPRTGPMCGNDQCEAGRVCASTGRCINPQYFHDCGNGTICSKAAACEHPKGCVFVSSKRTKQIRRTR
jgi:hypothetical protein